MSRARLATPIALAIVAAALVASVAELGNGLELRPPDASRGGWWRVVTCHLAHWSRAHLAWDAGALVLLALVCDRIDPRGSWRFAAALAASAIAISIGLVVFAPELDAYRGLSGVDSAAFALVAGRALKESMARGDRFERVVVAVALAGFVAKLVAELVTGSAFFASGMGEGVVAVPLAHAIGAAIGFAVSLSPEPPTLRALRPRKEASYEAALDRVTRGIERHASGRRPERSEGPLRLVRMKSSAAGAWLVASEYQPERPFLPR